MIINLASETDISGFYIVYEGSTLIENKSNWGISHLCEHLMCHSFEHLQDEFERNAIDWNAYTSNNEIVFHFTGLDDKLAPYKAKLLNLLSEYKIPEHRFLHERKIVLEEYLDTFNDQYSAHFENLLRKKYGLYSPIGSKRALQNLTIANMHAFAELQFGKPAKIINVSKNSPFVETIKCNTPAKKVDITAPQDFEYEESNDYKDKSSVIIGFAPNTEDAAYNKIINEMLGSGLNSPLYQEVREKRGLAYGVYNFQSRIDKYAMNYISALTSNENVQELTDVVFGVIADYKKHLSQERFNIIKESITARERIKLINRAYNIGDMIQPAEWNVYNILPTVTLDKILDVFETNYKLDSAYVSVDKREFENIPL